MLQAKWHHYVSILAIWLYLRSGLHVHACPDTCTCRDEGGGLGLAVKCWYSHLAEIPEDIGRETRLLDLRGNNLTVVKTRAFNGDDFPMLNLLYLDDNLIHSIEKEAFVSLNNLRKLSLRRNKISVLKSGGFVNIYGGAYCKLMGSKIQESCVLDLTGNNILVIETGAFQGLFDISIFLGGQSLPMTLRSTIFSNNTHLNYLRFSNLPRLDINQKQGSSFADLSVKTFELKSLSLKSIPPGTFREVLCGEIIIRNVNISGLHRGSFSINPVQESAEILFENCDIKEIPHGLMYGSPFHKLTFLACKIDELDNKAFSGLNSLKTINIEGGHPYAPDLFISPSAFDSISGLDWLIIKNLSLDIYPFAFAGMSNVSGGILISDCSIDALGENSLHLASLNNVRELKLDNTLIGAVHPNAFGNKTTSASGPKKVTIHSTQDRGPACGLVKLAEVLKDFDQVNWEISWNLNHTPGEGGSFFYYPPDPGPLLQECISTASSLQPHCSRWFIFLVNLLVLSSAEIKNFITS